MSERPVLSLKMIYHNPAYYGFGLFQIVFQDPDFTKWLYAFTTGPVQTAAEPQWTPSTIYLQGSERCRDDRPLVIPVDKVEDAFKKIKETVARYRAYNYVPEPMEGDIFF